MAKARTEPPVADRIVASEGPPTAPVFRRATPRDAMDYARATFLSEARIDMGVLAEQLAVSRATLYRWCGSREQLHEQILEQRAREFTEWARAEIDGERDEPVLDVFRLVMSATAEAQPVRRFIEREPKLALRILTREHGAVHRVITDALCAVAAEKHTPRAAKALQERIDDAVHVAAVLQWASVAIDEEPETEHIINIVRTQLSR